MSQNNTGPEDKGSPDVPPSESDPTKDQPAAGETQQATAPSAGPEDGPGPDPAADPSGSDPKIAALEADCKQLREKLDEVLRAYAEGENRRKRLERDAVEQRKYAAGPLATDIASALDNLQRALATIDEAVAAENAVLKSFQEGVELTERELVKSLERHGVIRIEPKGEKFDPNQHEAMANMPSDTVPNGFVAEVFQAGYVLHERVLRPAKVVISQGPSQPQPEAQPASSPSSPEAGDIEPPTPANDTQPVGPGWQKPPVTDGEGDEGRSTGEPDKPEDV